MRVFAVCNCVRNWHDFAMATFRKKKRLLDAYRFPGLRPLGEVRGVFGNPKARVVTLVRRSKKLSAENVARRTWSGTTARDGACAIFPATTHVSIWISKYDESAASDVAK